MSYYATVAAWENPPASRTLLLVLLAYAHAANDDGDAFLSCASAARRCLLKDAEHVRRALCALVRSGHMVRLGPHSDPRYRYATVYRLPLAPPAGQRGVGVNPPHTPPAGQRGVDDPSTGLPPAGQQGYPPLGSGTIPLEILREREAGAERQGCHLAERQDGEVIPTAQSHADGKPCEAKAGKDPSPEKGQQRIRDELRRLVVSCGNSEHFSDWLNLARQAGAVTSADAVFVLRWMVERSRACGEAIKFPSHCTAQIFPARAALAAHHKTLTTETRQAL